MVSQQVAIRVVCRCSQRLTAYAHGGWAVFEADKTGAIRLNEVDTDPFLYDKDLWVTLRYLLTGATGLCCCGRKVLLVHCSAKTT